MSDITYREVDLEDCPAIAGLLGRAPDEGDRLRRRLQAEYDPWFAWVAEAPPRPFTSGAPGRTAIAGAVVAGAPRARTDPGSTGRMVEVDPDAPDGAGKVGRIVWLGVAPAFRRQGIGGRLLQAALDELRHRRLRRAALSVDGTQVEALALFRKAGFITAGQSLGLVLPPEGAARLAQLAAAPGAAVVRPVGLDDVPLLQGLLIQLGIERAEQPHDDLPALTPAQVEAWLQRPGTAAYGAWEVDDARSPLGLAWATRRRDDAALRFVGVQDDARRRGIGRALLAALVEAVAYRAAPLEGAGTAERLRPLRAHLNDPGPEQEFFRRLGFEAERVTYEMERPLLPTGDAMG